MTGADLLVRCLAAHGIDTVFALPGEETADLMDALDRSSLDVVLCRHEQAAAFMASVHGRLTGRPAICLATLGPGATNLLTGVADATLDFAPLIAVTGQGARSRVGRGQDSHQILNLERLFEPVARSSRMIWTAQEIPGAVAEAVALSQRPRPGAVHLSLPEDLAGLDIVGKPEPLPQAHPTKAPAEATHEAAAQVAGSQRPILLAGAGVLRSQAAPELAAFLAETGIPMATSFMAKGLLPPDDPQHLGAFGLPSEDHVDKAIHAADLIVTVGLDPVEYPLEKLTGQGDIPVASLTPVSLASTPGWTPRVEVAGDLATALTDLTAALETRRWSVWPEAERARTRLQDDLAAARSRFDRSPPDAAALSVAVGDALKPNDLLISGVGTHKLALARNLHPCTPGQMIIGNGLAGMGIALPGAIAAARLGTYEKVLAVCGDGEVMMNIQEMETAARLDLPMTVVVWIDGGFGLIEDKQRDSTGTRPDLSFASMDWAQLAGAFGWSYLACDTASELHTALADRSSSGGRCLITVPVSYDRGLS